MLGRKREEMWGVSAAPRSFPAPLCSPHLKAVTEPPPKPVLLGKKKKKKCGDLLATSPGLVRTLLAADRERTLTSAGRSHPAPQHPGLLCPARDRSGAERGGSPGTHRPCSRAASEGSDTRVPLRKGQARVDIPGLKADALY